jgi:hypothetical protein
VKNLLSKIIGTVLVASPVIAFTYVAYLENPQACLYAWIIIVAIAGVVLLGTWLLFR